GNHAVYYAVVQGFFRIHPVVAVEILHHLFKFFAAVLCQDTRADLLYPAGLFGSYFQVNAYALHMSAQAGLMDHDLSVGVDKTAAFYASAEQYRTHGRGQSHAD